MGTKKMPSGPHAPADLHVVRVAITLPPVERHPLHRRLARVMRWQRTRRIVAATLVLLTVAGLVASAMLHSSARRSGAARLAATQAADRAAIASAFGYPYPLRCLTITISASNPDYARAVVDRTRGCGHYHGYINASFHEVAGAWRLVLDEGQLFVPNSLLRPLAPRGRRR